jgi:hypothetical protein
MKKEAKNRVKDVGSFWSGALSVTELQQQPRLLLVGAAPTTSGVKSKEVPATTPAFCFRKKMDYSRGNW